MCVWSCLHTHSRKQDHTHTRTHTQLVAEKASTSSLRPSLEAVKTVAGPRYAGLIERCWQCDSALRPSASVLVDELEVAICMSNCFFLGGHRGAGLQAPCIKNQNTRVPLEPLEASEAPALVETSNCSAIAQNQKFQPLLAVRISDNSDFLKTFLCSLAGGGGVWVLV